MTIKRLLGVILLFVINYSLYSGQVYSDYESMLKDFKDISYDMKNVKSIQNFILPLSYGELFLEEGTYYPLTPMNGKVYGGLFVGSGNFEFSIPNTAEKRQLKRFYQRENINSPIEWALVFSANDLNNQLLTSGSAAQISKEPTEAPLKMLKFCNMSSEKEVVFSDIAKVLLDGEENNYTYHIVKVKDIEDPLVYQVIPRLIEPIVLYRVIPDALGFHSEQINQFFYKDDSGRIIKALHDDNYFHPLKYTVKLNLEKNFLYSYDMSIELKALKETGKWILTNLFANAEIDEIKLNGEDVKYFREKGFNGLCIRLPKSFSPGDVCTLSLKFHNPKKNHYVSGWLPSFGNGMKSYYDVTASYADTTYIFKTVGEEIERRKDNNGIVSRWVTSVPINSISYFWSDKYDSTSFISKNGNNINVWAHKNDINLLKGTFQNSFELVSLLFGALPNRNVLAIRFAGNTNYGYTDISSYSIPELWWESVVDCLSYRDTWLSNATCGYASLLYIQSIQKDSIEFYNRLKESAKSIKAEGVTLFSESKKSGIIAVGYRNSDDYWDILNNKTTWVMHMLRMIMKDLNTMNDDIFVATLRDFFKSNAGREVTTQDFIDCVERNTKFDFSWFFEQWLNTNDIPTYKYAYKTEKVNGKYVTKFKVKQENVPADFKMLIPIALIDDDKKVTASRTYITGAKTVEFELAPTDTEPDEVIFNYLEGVLCELDEEGWNSL